MRDAGSGRQGSWYVCGGKRVRVVQGAGQAISTVKERFSESPAIRQPDIVVCAGAVDSPIPGRLISSGHGASIVRPQSGGSAVWMTDEQAKTELGIGRVRTAGGGDR